MTKKDISQKNSETSWGGVAEWYDELLEESPDSFQVKVILPNLLRILNIKSGTKIIDIACGQGYFSRALAAQGAEVTGVDISSELIEKAKGRSSSEINFQVGNAEVLAFIADNSFDTALIILSLQNIKNLNGALGECARVLKPKGKLIIVLNHPTFRIPQRSSWGWDEKNKKQYRRVDWYLSNDQKKIDMTPGEMNKLKKKTTVSFHRPLQSYFNFLNKNGFAVTGLEEWISHRQSQKGPRSIEENRIRKEIPMFLMLEATKS